MRAQRGSKIYSNILDYKVIQETDNDYKKRRDEHSCSSLIAKLFLSKRIRVHNINDKGIREKNVFYINKNDGAKVYFSYYAVANSGLETDRKRLQIYAEYFGKQGVNRNEEDVYFFIGQYPIGSNGEVVYVLLDNDGISLDPQTSYSSLWINFEALKVASIKGIYYAINKVNGNKYVCFNQEYWDLVLPAILTGEFSSIISNNKVNYEREGKMVELDDAYVEDYVESRDAYIFNKKPKLRKNSNYRDLILYESKYQCSLCGKSVTFKTNANVMYFEAHHLIPCNFNNQQNFSKKLDAPQNMYCLCPECHRKIHFIKDDEVRGLIILLYEKRKGLLEKIYNIKAIDIVNLYNKTDRRNEEEM